MAVFIIKIITQDKKTYLLNSLNFMQNTNVETTYAIMVLFNCYTVTRRILIQTTAGFPRNQGGIRNDIPLKLFQFRKIFYRTNGHFQVLR